MENTLPLLKAVPLAYPTLKESWVAFGWLVLLMLVVSVLARPFSAASVHGKGQRRLWILLGASKLAMLLTIVWLRRRAGLARWPGLVLQELPTRWQLYAVLPVLVLAQVVVLSVVGQLHLPNWFASTFQEIANYPVLMVVSGCAITPVLEEAIFRGILLKGLLRNYRPAVAIMQSALLFGFMHFNPAQSVAAMLTGLLLGWLYYRTRSLGLCISFHAFNNLLAYSYLHIISRQNYPTSPRFTSWQQYWTLIATASLVLSAIIWWVQRSTTPAVNSSEGNYRLASELV